MYKLHIKKKLNASRKISQEGTPWDCTYGSLHILCFSKKDISSYLLINFLRYKYIYLIHKKSHIVNVLDMYICEIDRQLDKKNKIIRSDKGWFRGWFYVKYDESSPVSFVKFLEKRCIYT